MRVVLLEVMLRVVEGGFPGLRESSEDSIRPFLSWMGQGPLGC